MTLYGSRTPKDAGQIGGGSAPADSLARRGANSRWSVAEPDFNGAMTDYARLAEVYDSETRWIDSVRSSAIERLALQPGKSVVDVACGTGFCLPALCRAVGNGGSVVGVEPSDVMMAHARARCKDLPNLQLICSPAQTVRSRVVALAAKLR